MDFVKSILILQCPVRQYVIDTKKSQGVKTLTLSK